MNRVVLQLWEESNIISGIFTDGCSIHVDESERINYINSVYNIRQDNSKPESYDRIIGGEIEVFVSDVLYNKISTEKSIKLSQVEFNNLIALEELIFNYATI